MTKMTPLIVACPACQARPGHHCTQPSIMGRRIVFWFHLAREEELRIAQEREEGK